jgi:hypothetical protein
MNLKVPHRYWGLTVLSSFSLAHAGNSDGCSRDIGGATLIRDLVNGTSTQERLENGRSEAAH